MLRAQLLVTTALAATYFVPAGPAPNPSAPMLRGTPVLSAPVEILPPAPQTGALPGAAAALAFVAGAAATFTAFRSAGPRMQEASGLKLNGKQLLGASDEFFNQV